jgi:hypothetical protein
MKDFEGCSLLILGAWGLVLYFLFWGLNDWPEHFDVYLEFLVKK